MKITWSPLAIERVAEQARVIARDKPEAAVRWAEGILSAVDRLESNPLSGREVPEIRRTEVREIIQTGYRIIYRVAEDEVFILTVCSSWRLLDPLEIDPPPAD